MFRVHLLEPMPANVSKFTNPREPGEARRSGFPAFHHLHPSLPAGQAAEGRQRELIVICSYPFYAPRLGDRPMLPRNLSTTMIWRAADNSNQRTGNRLRRRLDAGESPSP